MLILTRSPRQRIIVGPMDVIIEVLSVKGHQVKIGVTAPDGVPIHREEIYDRIVAENLGAEQKVDTDTTPDPHGYGCVAPGCDSQATKHSPTGSNHPVFCDEHFGEMIEE